MREGETFFSLRKKKFALHEFYLNFCKFSYKCLYLQTNLGREGRFSSENLDNLLDANRLGYVINMQNFNVKTEYKNEKTKTNVRKPADVADFGRTGGWLLRRVGDSQESGC